MLAHFLREIGAWILFDLFPRVGLPSAGNQAPLNSLPILRPTTYPGTEHESSSYFNLLRASYNRPN
jgi:hypothetical protein